MIWRASLALVLLGMTSVPATAQPGSGGGNDRAERRFREYVTCVVRGDPGRARALLQTTPESAEETELLRRVAVQRRGCLSGGMLRFGGARMRGLVAEMLYHSAFPGRPPAGDPAAQVLASGSPQLLAHDMARCVVRRDPPSAHLLLDTESGSAEERAAIAGLGAVMSSCFVPGSTLRVNRPTLRGLLAEALFNYRGGALNPAPRGN